MSDHLESLDFFMDVPFVSEEIELGISATEPAIETPVQNTTQARDEILGVGEDTFTPLANQGVFWGGLGDDTFNAVNSQGNNWLIGFTGDDYFILGSNDFVVGSPGDDTFELLLGGGNLISGGVGNDTYLLVGTGPLASPNIITDFGLGRDQLRVASNANLNLVDQGDDVAVQVKGNSLLVVKNIDVETLQSALIIQPFSINFEVQTLDGSNNNPLNATLGQVNQPYSRVSEAFYADGIGEVYEGPDARYVSNRIFNDQRQNLFSENNVSQWASYWGQFLDHTFGLRESGGEIAPIPFDVADPLEDFQNDFGVIQFDRSAPAPGTGETSPREQLNTVSSFIDGWAIYGGTEERLEWLREGEVDGDLSNNGAKLLLTSDGYLPQVGARGDASTAPAMELPGQLRGAPFEAVVAGDVRANENIGLTSIHTLFAREHNRLVDLLPVELGEEIRFQIARKVVTAQQQYITYNEFLPSLGLELDPYQGYDPTVDPSISNEFAASGYRAHSMLHGEIEFETEVAQYTDEALDAFAAEGIEVEVIGDEVEIAVPLSIAFGNPTLVPELGIEQILVAFASEAQYKNDEQIDNQLRSVLFQIPVAGGNPDLPSSFTTVLDLGAIDIQRGRDHGIPLYNDLREAYGLPRLNSFTEITGEATDAFPAGLNIDSPESLEFVSLFDINGNPIDPNSDAAEGEAVTGIRRTTLAARLKAIYGEVDNIDAFVGMTSEAHLPGSEFGELQGAIWREQFEALRDGDRFFYLNNPDLARIEAQYGLSYQRTLADVIIDNTDLSAGMLPSNVFQIAA